MTGRREEGAGGVSEYLLEEVRKACVKAWVRT